jgi:predicted ester cyclase
MSVEQNKAAVRRLHEVINKRDWLALPGLFATTYVNHNYAEMKGPAGVKQMFTTLTNAFPDYSEKIEHMVAEGDLVAVSYTLSGTFTGKYGDIAPTGKKFSMPNLVLARFKDGKQVEAWMYGDSLAWYQQLGISPPAQG